MSSCPIYGQSTVNYMGCLCKSLGHQEGVSLPHYLTSENLFPFRLATVMYQFLMSR